MLQKTTGSCLRLKHLMCEIHANKNQITTETIRRSQNILILNAFSYVKIKDLNEIKENNKQKGLFKVISKSCGFFMKQAWNDFKTDYRRFNQISSIPLNQRTPSDKNQYRKIKIDMIKFGPAFLIFNIPFGFPLFYLYLTLFPQLIPSWMMVDSIHQKTVQQRQKRKAQAWEYFTNNYSKQLRLAYLKEAIFKENQNLEDLRKISCLCYNDYIDGTQYLTSKLGLRLQNGLIVPKISIFILKMYLKNELNHDYEIENPLEQLGSFQEKLFFKLQKKIQEKFP